MRQVITEIDIETLSIVDEINRSRWKTSGGFRCLASYLRIKEVPDSKQRMIFDSFVCLENEGYVDNGVEDYNEGICGLSSVGLTEKGKHLLSELVGEGNAPKGAAVAHSPETDRGSTCVARSRSIEVKPERHEEPKQQIALVAERAEDGLQDEALAAIRLLLEDIKAQLPGLAASNVMKAEIYSDAAQIEVEVERPAPRRRFMKLYLESLRDNLAKAAGVGTATALVTAVGAILAKFFGVF